MNTIRTGIGAEVKMAVGLEPAARAAGTVTGPAIDRLGFESCVLEVMTGAVTGAPSAQTLDVKLQHSDTAGGTYTDYNPSGAGSGAVEQITAASSRKRKSIDLSGAKQWIKVSATTGFTGGTSPTLHSAVSVVLGGAVQKPAQADD